MKLVRSAVCSLCAALVIGLAAVDVLAASASPIPKGYADVLPKGAEADGFFTKNDLVAHMYLNAKKHDEKWHWSTYCLGYWIYNDNEMGKMVISQMTPAIFEQTAETQKRSTFKDVEKTKRTWGWSWVKQGEPPAVQDADPVVDYYFQHYGRIGYVVFDIWCETQLDKKDEADQWAQAAIAKAGKLGYGNAGN